MIKNENHIQTDTTAAVHPVERKAARILIVTAVAAERDAVLRGLESDRDCKATECFDVVAVGVGPAAAAAGTMAALLKADYDLVISAGIGGGFVGRAEIGSVVIATEIVAADLGAETPDGFFSLDELGFGTTRIAVDGVLAHKLAHGLARTDLTVILGPVLSVSTATGTLSTAIARAERIPGAAAEGMEGYGVAIAAFLRGLPVIETRAISNSVGLRDRSSWRIEEALHALTIVSSRLTEVLI
ncbi:MAG: futalosine hydrolase [Gorillibacterium sp.]|nr:futalosine hydrolase [Gorillibacterium sp.]